MTLSKDVSITSTGNLPPHQVEVRFGDQTYTWKVVRQCLVCQSKHRMFIENEALKGRSYANIFRELEMMEHGATRMPTQDSIKLHFTRGHSSVPQQARQRLLEAEASRQGLDQSLNDIVVTPHMATQAILQRGWERFLKGDFDVDMSSWLASMKNQMELDASSSTGGLTTDLLYEVLARFLTLAKTKMDPASYADFARSTSRDPILRPLLEQIEGKAPAKTTAEQVKELPPTD